MGYGYHIETLDSENLLTTGGFAPQSRWLLYSPVCIGLLAAATVGGLYALVRGLGMRWLNIFGPKKAQAAPQIPYASPMLTVTTRPGEDGYIVAECPELPGCMSQGRDEREALDNIVDAIQSCLAVHLIQFLNKSGHPSGRVGERFKVKPPELELIDV